MKHGQRIKWEKFARGLIQHGDTGRAYEEAGYNCAKREYAQARAAKLMKQAEFKKMFELMKAEIDQRTNRERIQAILKTALDREWVMDNLAKVYTKCVQETPVVDSQGEPIGEYKFDAGNAIECLKLIGMENQMFLRKPGTDAPGAQQGAMVNINLIDSRDDFRRLAIEYLPKTLAPGNA